MRFPSLDPVKDKTFIDRIAHAKVCLHWGVGEDTCHCHLWAEWDKLTPEERTLAAKDGAEASRKHAEMMTGRTFKKKKQAV